MRFNLVLTGIILGMTGGYFAGQLGSQKIVDFFDNQSSSIITTCIIIFALVVVAFLYSEKFIKTLTSAKNTQITTWFDNATASVFEVFKISEKTALSLAQPARDALAIYITWRTRSILLGLTISIIVIIVGTISTHVMIEQNKKLEAQNVLITEQNGAVRAQLLLEEAARYKSYADRVENLSIEIATEAQTLRRAVRQELISEGEKFAPWYYAFVTLDQSYWDKISSTLNLSQPYPIFDTKKIATNFDGFTDLDVEFLSAERGRILKTLMSERVRLDDGRKLNFSHADLRNFSLLSPFHVEGYRLDYCGDPKTHLSYHLLNDANLSGSIFSSVDFGFNTDFIASPITLANSRITLRSGSKLMESIGTSGAITLVDSQVTLDGGDRDGSGNISLQNVNLGVLELKKNESNCTNFNFVYDENSTPIIPNIDFTGATIITGGTAEFGNSNRQESFKSLNRISTSDEVTVSFSEIVDTVLLLLLEDRDSEHIDEIKLKLLKNNSESRVTIRSGSIPSDVLNIDEDNIWSDGTGKVFILSFN